MKIEIELYGASKDFSSKNIMDVISESELPEFIKHKVKLLTPVLFNCYFVCSLKRSEVMVLPVKSVFVLSEST